MPLALPLPLTAYKGLCEGTMLGTALRPPEVPDLRQPLTKGGGVREDGCPVPLPPVEWNSEHVLSWALLPGQAEMTWVASASPTFSSLSCTQRAIPEQIACLRILHSRCASEYLTEDGHLGGFVLFWFGFEGSGDHSIFCMLRGRSEGQGEVNIAGEKGGLRGDVLE